MRTPRSELNTSRTCYTGVLQRRAINESMKCEAGTIVAAEKGVGSAMLVSIEKVLLVNATEMRLPACIAPPANANCRGQLIGIRGSIQSQRL